MGGGGGGGIRSLVKISRGTPGKVGGGGYCQWQPIPEIGGIPVSRDIGGLGNGKRA